MRIKVAVMAAVLVASCAGQVTEQAPGPLFWVSSVRNNMTAADQTPPFEFHWNVGADHVGVNPARVPENLDSYVVIVYYFGSREEHKSVNSTRWAGFHIPGNVGSLPEGLGVAPAFGPGAGPGPIDHYEFEFYALDTKMELPPDTSIRGLLEAMNGHMVGKTTWFDRASGLAH